MTQIFFPSKPDDTEQQVYCYFNDTSKIAIVRILGLETRYCERVVFPQEKFLFEANNDCELEITQHTVTGIIKNTIPCSQLQKI